jgi:uracil-DNA glycosylase family 4
MRLSSHCSTPACLALCSSRSRIVWGEWHNQSPGSTRTLMYIGEAPGKWEDKQGRPFVGMTGQEVRSCMWRAGLAPFTYYTNLVKCRPKDDRDPTPDEIAGCEHWLWEEVDRLSPSLIVTAGRFSTAWALGRGDYTMEMVSGIPYHSPLPRIPCPVLPMIHPAAGFHMQRNMVAVMDAFAAIKEVWEGRGMKVREIPEDDGYGHTYSMVSTGHGVQSYLNDVCRRPDVLGVDTEDGPGDKVDMIQVSGRPRTAIGIWARNTEAVEALAHHVNTQHPVVVMHNAAHDLPKLHSLGIRPDHVTDTMVMAYMLQNKPLGLKPLAWRIAGVRMKSYTEMIWDARRDRALAYLREVAPIPWPDPEPILVRQKGEWRVKSPQGIGKKAKRIISDVESGKRLKDGELIDPRKRWHQIGGDEGRGIVEGMLGPMPDAYLRDIDPQDATEYACKDADMTLTIYPVLLDEMKGMGMDHLLPTEEGVMRMVAWMHESGMPVDVDYFRILAVALQDAALGIETDILRLTGFDGQLASAQQVSHHLYDDLGLRRYLPKKRSKKMGVTMTGNDVLAQLSHLHPIIPMIQKHRKLDKLKGTYAEGVPRHVKEDGRVHPDIRMTNTDTGRMSCSDPNLMAQPKRDKEWAKRIRMGFKAPDGFVFLSMDYSQQELRLTAHEAGEEGMIQAFTRGIDLHAMTAYEMFFDRPDWSVMTLDQIEGMLSRVDKMTQRLPAKTINFGIIYGIGPDGLYRNMVTVKGCEHWTVDLAQEYIDQYLASKPGIQGYINETEAMAKRHGYVWDWAGRIRRIPGARLTNQYYQAEALRQACNARIQTGAASITKAAMAELEPVYREWVEMGIRIAPCIPIHDDIVSLVEEDALPVVVPVQKEIMEGVVKLKTGLRVDVEYGRNWGEMEAWEE